MSIRERWADARTLAAAGRHEGAMLALLVCVAATSRRRFPRGTPSRRGRGDMGDGEAFETFFVESWQETGPFKGVSVRLEYRDGHERIEHIFYKFMRCELVHEGALPEDVQLVLEQRDGTVSFQAGGLDSPVCIGLGWLNQLAAMVARAPEKAAEFANVNAPAPPGPRPADTTGGT